MWTFKPIARLVIPYIILATYLTLMAKLKNTCLNLELKSHEHNSGLVVVFDKLWIFGSTSQSLLFLKMFHEIFQMLEQRPVGKQHIINRPINSFKPFKSKNELWPWSIKMKSITRDTQIQKMQFVLIDSSIFEPWDIIMLLTSLEDNEQYLRCKLL